MALPRHFFHHSFQNITGFHTHTSRSKKTICGSQDAVIFANIFVFILNLISSLQVESIIPQKTTDKRDEQLVSCSYPLNLLLAFLSIFINTSLFLSQDSLRSANTWFQLQVFNHSHPKPEIVLTYSNQRISSTLLDATRMSTLLMVHTGSMRLQYPWDWK